MKAMVCEMCDSNDFVKQDGLYICQQCGTKYTVEEAKKLMVDKPDSSDKNKASDSASNPEINNIAKTDEAQKKKSRKKIIVLTSVIAGIILVLLVGLFVGLKVFKDYQKEEIINNSANEITGNTWKSISSDTTITVKENGGTYGKYNINSWNYNAPVLSITYQEPPALFKETSPQTVTLNLSWYNDDILQLTTAGEKGECFVKESDYNKVKELIKKQDNSGSLAKKENGNKKEISEAVSRAKNVNLGDAISLDYVEMTLNKFEVSDGYNFESTDNSAGISIKHIANIDCPSGMKLVCLKGKFTNKSKGEIFPSNNPTNAVMTINDSEYKTQFDCYDVDAAESIMGVAAQSQVDYFLYAEVPDNVASAIKSCEVKICFVKDLDSSVFPQSDSDYDQIYVLSATPN